MCEQATWDDDGYTCSIPLRISDANPNAPLSCKILVSAMEDSWKRAFRPFDAAIDVEPSDIHCQVLDPSPNKQLWEGAITIRGNASGRYGINSVTVNDIQASLKSH